MKYLRLLSFLSVFATSACGNSSSESDKDQGSEEALPSCTTTAECPDGGICRDEECHTPQSCETQDDCGINRECDTERSICVECLVGDDCAEGQTCLANVCRTACEVSRDCGGDLSCAENGFCTECLNDNGCAADEHCTSGACVPDTCAERGTTCTQEGNVQVCSDRGDSFVELPCAEGEACGTDQGPAWCQSWICVPDESVCAEDDNVAVTCSPDGLTIAKRKNCDDTNSLCIDGACEPFICEAGTVYCKDGDVYRCDTLGISEAVENECYSFEYCDEKTAACRVQICEPGELGCDKGQVGTCNDLGSAFEDLSACEMSQVCDAGACEPIVCAAGQRFCDELGVRQCNALGTGSSRFETCTLSEFCNDSVSVPYCSTDVCQADQPACDGDILGTCKPDGSGLKNGGKVDCTSAGQVCVAGQCKDTICAVPERLCVAGDVHQCISKGSATQLYDSCNGNEYCDSVTATCTPQVCAPALPGCDGQMARVCNADGSGWNSGGTDCAALTNKSCDAGSCDEVICSIGGRYCDGTQAMTCNATGTGGTLFEACPSNEHCFASSPTNAYCRLDSCTADGPVCNGSLATTCAADGSGPLPGGTDCADTGDACHGGSCLPIVCAGTYECVDGDFHRCINNGTSTSLQSLCSASQYCSETQGCRTHVCTPDSVVCQSSASQRICNADGSNYSVAPCNVATERCWDGQCLPILCTEGETFCRDGDFHNCNDNSTGSSLLNICVEAQYCDPTNGCLPDVCTANAPTCNGDLVTTCNADGSGPLPGGVDCAASGEACFGATCLPSICTDGSYSCNDQELSQCIENGTNVTILDDCAAGTHCSATAGACLVDVCTPGETVCLDFETVVTCAADGAGYESPGTTCSTGDVCDQGACVANTSTCSIAGKSWSTPELLTATSSSYLDLAADLQGNLITGWVNSNGLYGATYSSAADAWTVTLLDPEAQTYGSIAVAASTDGHGMITYISRDDATFTENVTAIHFDPGLVAWSAPVTLADSAFVPDLSLLLEGTTQGRFGLVYSRYDGAFGTHFDPEFGWAAPTQLDNSDRVHAAAMDVTLGGKVVAVWLNDGATPGVWWSTLDMDIGAWPSAQRVEAAPAPAFALGVTARNAEATEIWFAYEADGFPFTQLNAKRWTLTGGLESPQTISDESFAQTIKFVAAPDGDLFLFSDVLQNGRLPAGTNTWVAEPSRYPRRDAFAFPSNDMLVLGPGRVETYIEGGGWSLQAYSSRSAGSMVPLPGCRAAWIYRNGATYVTFLE